MATTKLTLSMEPEIVNKAKVYAKKKNKFIQAFNIHPDILALTGILEGKCISKKQLKDIKYEYLKDKYGL